MNDKNVVRLGFVSLLNDLASEILTRLLPFFVSGVLGAPMSVVGGIEGLAETTSTLLKPVFGSWSDRLRQRKAFIICGYAFSAIPKPLLALAGSWPFVAFLRFFDRLGKGVRTAPRDALVADAGTKSEHGRHFGINRALDTLGAFLSVTAYALWLHRNGQTSLNSTAWSMLCLACTIPAVLAVVLVVFGVKENEAPAERPGRFAAAPSGEPLSRPLKRYLAIIAVFSLANSSDAFILLRAQKLGYSLPEILGMVALLNVVSLLTILPASNLSDRVGRRSLVVLGWIIYAGSYAILGSELPAHSPLALIATVSIYGLFYGFTDSVERAWIADLTTPSQRGRAYGYFGWVVGLTALPASLLFGWLWDHWGSQIPFYGSAGLAMLAALLLTILM